MKKVVINLSNRLFYTLIGLGVFVLLAVGVYALAPNPGHSLSEIDWSGVISSATITNLITTGITTNSIAANTITLGGVGLSSWNDVGGVTYTKEGSTCFPGDTPIGYRVLAKTCSTSCISQPGKPNSCTIPGSTDWVQAIPSTNTCTYYMDYGGLGYPYGCITPVTCTTGYYVLCQD